MAGLADRVSRWLGVDHGGGRYGYVDDPVRGPVSASRAVDRWVRTTCGYCSVGCGMRIGVRDGRAVAVEGDPGHPVNRGRLCPKGLSEHQTLAARGRLTVPTVDGRAASWDAALDRVVTGFRSLLDRHGPESVAVLSTGQLVTEEFYALGKLVRLGMGLAHYDGNTTLCMASAVAGYKLSFGTDGPPGCYDDLAEADVVVLWGANLADNHPLLMPRLLRPGRRPTTVVVDPRVTKTATIADVHLPVRPRGDIALLNGVLVTLLEEGLVAIDTLRGHVDGLDDLVAHLAGWSVVRAARESGIDADAIRKLARTIAGAERCTIAWTMGVNHSVQGTQTVTLINTVCLLTGHIGRPGSAPFSVTGQCNAMGTREAGFTASMPGYRAYDAPAARAELAALWGVDEARLPAARGRAYPDIVNAVMGGRIKGLWIIATNPPVSFPNREVLEHALANLDLLVVQDGFETPTTALADVVLPAAIWGEKEGTYTNSERRVSRVRAAVEPPGEARSDFAIFLDVARRWGCAGELFGGWSGPRDAFEEWRRVSAGRPCDYSGMTWERIDAAGGVQWPCPAGDPAVPLGGTPRLYTDRVFPRPGGRAQVLPVEPEPIRDAPRPGYPFLLNTGRTVEHWHTRTKTGRVPILEALAPEA
jgi:assimilatory nitrate reductase catalytic subunit